MKKKKLVDIINGMIGLKVWQARLGMGFITLDFGKHIKERINTSKGIRTIVTGEWHLWVYMCAWRIDKNNVPIAGSGDEKGNKCLEKCIKIIQSKTLKKFSIISNAFDARLEFDGNINLTLFAYNTEENIQWKLFTPAKKVLIAGPSMNWVYEDSDKK